MRLKQYKGILATDIINIMIISDIYYCSVYIEQCAWDDHKHHKLIVAKLRETWQK